MSKRPPTIFLSAAEASGDAHGAALIESIRRLVPDARFVGAAGRKMAQAGCEVIADLTQQASMLAGPLLKLGYYIPMLLRLKGAIRKIRPDVHVPIDSPALNWHLAAAARAVGTPVAYYLSPQVWAWGPWRVKKLARLTDRVACILPFEQRYLRDRGVNATYVGHPLFDTLCASSASGDPPEPPDLLDAYGQGTWRVALLAGSRTGEIAAHTKALLACARAIHRRWPQSECTFCAADERAAEAIRKRIGGADIPVAPAQTAQILARSHFAITASGTVTLEAAHFGVPMVVFYRASRFVDLVHLVGAPFGILATPHLSLVNILAGQRMVPELMPWHGEVDKLVDIVLEVMDDLAWLIETRSRLREIVAPLSAAPGQTASDNAAKLIVDLMNEPKAAPRS